MKQPKLRTTGAASPGQIMPMMQQSRRRVTQRLLVFSRQQPLIHGATDVTTLLASMSDLLSRSLGENIDVVT